MAAEIAGLNVLKIISEPVAAALAFGHSSLPKEEEEENIVVYDLGQFFYHIIYYILAFAT